MHLVCKNQVVPVDRVPQRGAMSCICFCSPPTFTENFEISIRNLKKTSHLSDPLLWKSLIDVLQKLIFDELRWEISPFVVSIFCFTLCCLRDEANQILNILLNHAVSIGTWLILLEIFFSDGDYFASHHIFHVSRSLETMLTSRRQTLKKS